MEMQADKDAMFALGQKYHEAGLMLTPKDCQPIDTFIFTSTKGMDPLIRLRVYNELRGSFNRGWNKAHAKQ